MTSQSLIERVARAIAKAWGYSFDALHRDKAHWTASGGKGPDGIFRDINEPRQTDFLEMARAAIAAMREPTPAMWAAEKAALELGVSPWHNMIDAALSEKPPER